MKKRGGGAQSQTPLSAYLNNSNAREHMPPSSQNARNHANNFSRDKLRVFIVTSLAWAIILTISIFVVIRIYSSNNCSHNTLATSALCGISRAFSRFCSDDDLLEEWKTFRPIKTEDKIQSMRGEETVSKEKRSLISSIEYKDSYEKTTCKGKQFGGQCSQDEQFFIVPDQSALVNAKSNRPGEMGKAYIPPNHLQEESKRRFPENMFDIVASDQISLDRSMPDIRNDHCKSHSTFNSRLPNTSIIIVFHNEGNSTLLRTLVSIIKRTPWRLIHEIILLDDASVDRDYLHEPLQEFIETLPVRTSLHRNEQRLGLISSRVKAAKMATGETLMFLDSHVEVLNGWLLYLLEEIQKDRKTIVCPIIDVLTWDAFELLNGATDIFGTFSWKMIFRWSKIHYSSTTNQAVPVRTPTMAGGLYAIDRLYFEEIGMYDEGIKIWGGENLEMSFKCWMCGGKIVIHPCSHVAHVFRKETPYKFLESESVFVTIFKNYKRVALVWLDEYKELIYAVNPDIKRLDGGDVSERLELRDRLNCSTFKSYLEMFQLKNFPFTDRWVGTVSTSNARCLDTMMGPDISKGLKSEVSVQKCHQDGGNQIFMYTTTNKLQFDELCLEPSEERSSTGKRILFNMCEHDRVEQNWLFDEQTLQLKHQVSYDQCLGVTGQSTVILAKCDTNVASQKWTFNQEVQLHN